MLGRTSVKGVAGAEPGGSGSPVAASVVVGKLGTATVTPAELKASIDG